MFNKVKSLSQFLIVSYIIRLLATGASIGDAIVIIALSSIYGLHMYLDHKKEPVANQELKDRIVNLEELVHKTSSKVAAIQLRR